MPEHTSSFLEGYADGCRYYIDGHLELADDLHLRSPEYQKGFHSAKEHPRVADPDFAS